MASVKHSSQSSLDVRHNIEKELDSYKQLLSRIICLLIGFHQKLPLEGQIFTEDTALLLFCVRVDWAFDSPPL